MKTKASTLHNYQVGYRRVPTGMVYNSTFKETTVQGIMETLAEIEPDSHIMDVVYIVMIPDNAINK